MIKFFKNIFKVKIWGVLAHESDDTRGNCYTLMTGRFFPLMVVGMAYEKDREGNPTKGFDKIRIL